MIGVIVTPCIPEIIQCSQEKVVIPLDENFVNKKTKHVNFLLSEMIVGKPQFWNKVRIFEEKSNARKIYTFFHQETIFNRKQIFKIQNSCLKNASLGF